MKTINDIIRIVKTLKDNPSINNNSSGTKRVLSSTSRKYSGTIFDKNVEVPVSTYVASNILFQNTESHEYDLSEYFDIKEPKFKHKMSPSIANEWALTFGIDNSNNEFTKFVDELYDVTDKLNISVLTFERDIERFPTKEDQIVDELCRMFANESEFKTNADNSGCTFGIFQFAPVSLKDLLDKTVNGIDIFDFNDLKTGGTGKIITKEDYLKMKPNERLEFDKKYMKNNDFNSLGNKGIDIAITKEEYANMDTNERYKFCENYLKNNFTKLSRLEQIKFFTKHIQNCKENFSNLSKEPVSVAQVYSMNWIPSDGKSAARIANRKAVLANRSKERNKWVYIKTQQNKAVG